MRSGAARSDILNRLTTVSSSTAAELTKALSAYYGRAMAVIDVRALLGALEARGYVTRRPREEHGHHYGADEYQLTREGARARARVGNTNYDPFATESPKPWRGESGN
jgi:hypothetical protein